MEAEFMKKNLFIVGTPYQLIAAYNACTQIYSSQEYKNIIYFKESSNTNYPIDANRIEGNIEILRFKDEALPSLIKQLKNEVFYRFCFYQENLVYNKYLSFHLKNKGSLISLGPDGTKPYGVFHKKHEKLSMLKDTLKDYRILRSKGLDLPKLFWSRYYRYGNFRLLDEVWLQYPELFNSRKNKTKGEIKKLPELTVENINKLVQLLDFKSKLTETNNIILYFNQPFYTKPLINKEFEILFELSQLYPEKKINIKLHPSTRQEVRQKMGTLPYVHLIEDNMPAEFYLFNVTNSIIISGWSAAIMHEFSSQNNKSYYLYLLYKKTKDKTLSQINFVGFPHIVMIHELKELVK